MPKRTNASDPSPPPDASDDRTAVPLRLEAFLPYRLSVLSNTISGAIATLYADRFGLSIPEWRVMAVVGRFAGLSARQVADRTAMDKVAVSRAVRRLEKAGRLDRSMSASDRRRSVLVLTPAGRQIFDEVAPLAMNYERRLLKGLSREERSRLDELLTRLMGRARTLG